ncbi:MAG: cysteine hydrolase family protein [bacterium]
METGTTALLLIGYQNDYFSSDGTLADFIDDRDRVERVLRRTLLLIEKCIDRGIAVISTPIFFSDNYKEIKNPIGILGAIQARGAFRRGQPGSDVISDFDRFADQIITVPGKRGLDAFSHTSLAEVLEDRNIGHIAVAGVVTALCIDSTGRAGFEAGLDVTILEDCTAGRTAEEQDFYCERIFPLYALVKDADSFLEDFQ